MYETIVELKPKNMSDNQQSFSYEEFELHMMKLVDKKNREAIDSEELRPIVDHYVKEYTDFMTEIIQELKEWIHEELGETIETDNLQLILSKLRSFHSQYEREFNLAKAEKDNLKLAVNTHNGKISTLKEKIQTLKQENVQLHASRNVSDPQLSLLTRMMDVEYVPNTDGKVNHALVKMGDEKHRFGSFEELEAIFKQ